MVLIWHERLLHSGVRTIINAGGGEGSFKVDMRCFSYVWQELQVGVPKSRSKVKVDDDNAIHCLKKNYESCIIFG